jgi:hypothetical protein
MDGDILTVLWLGPAQWALPVGPPRLVGAVGFTGAWQLLHFTSTFQFAPQFLYRYLLVCREWRLHFPVYLACLLAAPFMLILSSISATEWLPTDDPNCIRNPLTAQVLGMGLQQTAQGFAIRVDVYHFLLFKCNIQYIQRG